TSIATDRISTLWACACNSPTSRSTGHNRERCSQLKEDEMKATMKTLIGAVAGLAMATTAMAADITGAGATFPFPIYAKWAALYKGSSGVGLNYQSIGSGGGIAQIKAKTVTFGATDKPLTSRELGQAGLTQFPTVIGGVVPVVNIPGIGPGQLVLDGPTLANI